MCTDELLWEVTVQLLHHLVLDIQELFSRGCLNSLVNISEDVKVLQVFVDIDACWSYVEPLMHLTSAAAHCMDLLVLLGHFTLAAKSLCY